VNTVTAQFVANHPGMEKLGLEGRGWRSTVYPPLEATLHDSDLSPLVTQKNFKECPNFTI